MTVVALGACLAAAMTTPAAADGHAAIESPTAGEFVHEQTLQLEAHDSTATSGDVNWAVRDGCEPGGNFAGGGPNVSGFDDPSTWTADGDFAASIDISTWDAGAYCFVFNPTDTDTRLTQEFYIVDTLVEVGGTIGMGELGRGNSPTHTFDGVVADAGTAGILGEVTVNYRELRETVTYEADTLSLRDALGIGVDDDEAVAEIGTVDGGTILVLDRDASDDYPRGAIVVRPEGEPGTGDHEVDGTPGTTGPESWVPMERGNNHVRTR